MIAGDALRLWGDTDDDTDPSIVGLPEAIKLYKEDKNKTRRSRVKIPAESVLGSNQFIEPLEAGESKQQSDAYYFYRLYIHSRGWRASGKSRRVYRRILVLPGITRASMNLDACNSQTDLSMAKKHGKGSQLPQPSPFLFLIRSTQKTIFTMSQGSLAGGYGLPSDTTDIRVDGTQIKGRPVAAQVTDMLDILEQDGAGETEGKSLPDDLQLAKDPKSRAAQLDRLKGSSEVADLGKREELLLSFWLAAMTYALSLH